MLQAWMLLIVLDITLIETIRELILSDQSNYLNESKDENIKFHGLISEMESTNLDSLNKRILLDQLCIFDKFVSIHLYQINTFYKNIRTEKKKHSFNSHRTRIYEQQLRYTIP